MSKINSFLLKTTRLVSVILLLVFITLNPLLNIRAETLQSNNYVIENATVDSSGELLSSDTYNMLTSLGDINSDIRLTSGSYEIQGGFPNGVSANIPLVKCFESATDNSSSSCEFFPNQDGAMGECGEPGCYDKAKIEIDAQENPYDTLYLIRLQALTDNTIFYLKSDHTLGTSYDASNFMTICQLEGIDPNNPDCDTSESSGWNSDLQSLNIYNLLPDTEYLASALALNGDYSSTNFSENTNSQTVNPALSFDINIAPEDEPDTQTTAPYQIALGDISFKFPTIAPNLIWFSVGTNISDGLGLYIKDSSNGLYSASKDTTIPSETEDLAEDTNNNGGFGIKIFNYLPRQTSLGPLQNNTLYDTVAINSVGQVSTTNSLLFFTNSNDDNQGPINGGKSAIQVQAKAAYTTPISGDYETYFTTIIIGNY